MAGRERKGVQSVLNFPCCCRNSELSWTERVCQDAVPSEGAVPGLCGAGTPILMSCVAPLHTAGVCGG
ncbi:hypothetical protein O3P69_012797 [Scylla paramamosain]|uniref:Uncharacterized protein n=1 Tax=Scylla paramamosain TaxID=85552 RepID=A0AAW0TQ24_SCYPA